MVFVVIFIIIFCLALVFVLFKHITTFNRILTAFKNGNCIITGRKGFGKDVLMEDIIYTRKETYCSNLDYGGKFQSFTMKELEITPNDYNNFINGNIDLVPKNPKFEGTDIYISDAGVYLPSQYDFLLHKTYPSLSLVYAINRHLYNNGIHCNAQRIERIWKALREQADYFVHLRKRCLCLPFFIVVFTTEYDKYESAKQELLPMSSFLFNKYSKAEKAKFRAQNGFVKNGFVIVPKWRLKYDSRAFHEIVFGYKFEGGKSIWKRLKNIFAGSKKKEIPISQECEEEKLSS